jgi:zinc protease
VKPALRHWSFSKPAAALAAALAPLWALALAAPAPAAAAEAKPAAREFQVPHPQSRTLANGLVVHVFENHRLPTVYYRLLVRAGSANESAEKAGLAALTAAAMRQGTQSLSAQEVSEKIDNVGGELSVSAERDYSLAEAQARTSDADLALTLLAEMVVHPALAPAEVARMRSQTQASIRQSRDDPGTVADEHLAALIHGPHPYARPTDGDEQSVGGLTVEDVTTFHATYWRPNNAVLAVAGDVSADQVFAAVEKAFGDWQQGEIPPNPDVQSPTLTASRVRILDKPDLTQAQIRMGYVGLPRDTPDYFPVLLMNYVLGGGGFSSRLVAEVRAKAGLTYDVETSWAYGRDPGSFVLSTFTKNESVKSALDLTLGVVRRFREEGPTADELAHAKAFYLGAFPFGFETPGALAVQWLRAEYYGLGEDYFDRYRERVRAVTGADVKRVAQAYLRTEPAVFVVVGNAAEVAGQLTSFGQPETLAFTAPTGAIPEVSQTVPEAIAPDTPESRQQAAALVEKAVRAHGGLAAFRAVRDWATRGAVSLVMGDQSLDGQTAEYAQMPGRRRMEMTVMGRSMVQVVDGDRAWAAEDGQAHDLGRDQVEAMRVGSYGNIVRLFLALSDSAADLRYAGPHAFAGRPTEEVEWVRPGGKPARVYFDAGTGQLVGLEQPEVSPGGAGWVPVQRVFGDYRQVSGIRLPRKSASATILYPYRVTVYAGGTKAVETTLSDVQLNTGVATALFRRPGS